jgi:hypothetical protein
MDGPGTTSGMSSATPTSAGRFTSTPWGCWQPRPLGDRTSYQVGDGRDPDSARPLHSPEGATLKWPHPYHGSAAKRRAIPRLRSSRDTVEAAVMGPVASAGERTRLLRRGRRGTYASTRFQGRQRGDASARGLLPAQKITSVDAVQSRSRAGSRRLPAGACTPRRPRSPRSPRRGGRHEPPHPCGSTAGAAR